MNSTEKMDLHDNSKRRFGAPSDSTRRLKKATITSRGATKMACFLENNDNAYMERVSTIRDIYNEFMANTESMIVLLRAGLCEALDFFVQDCQHLLVGNDRLMASLVAYRLRDLAVLYQLVGL